MAEQTRVWWCAMTPQNSMKFALFVERTGSIKEKLDSWKDLFFPELHDREGS